MPIGENPRSAFASGEVSAKAALAALNLFRSTGLSSEPLVAGLSFDERSLRRKRFVPWDEYCDFIERAEVALGGPERIDALVLSSYHSIMPPEIKALFGAFASPRLLYRFFYRLFAPSIFPTFKISVRELTGGSLRLSLRLVSGYRPCLTFTRTSIAAFSGFSCHLGLPPAEVEVESLSADHLVVLVRLPDSRTLLQRTRRAARPAIHLNVLRAMEMLAWRSAEPDPAAPVQGAEADDRIRAARRSLKLTVRQTEVLAQLIRGRSNKEIASELDCAENTVEFHITQLLRKASVDSRTQLMAKLFAGRDG